MLRPFTQRAMMVPAMKLITPVATLTKTTMRNLGVNLKLPLAPEPCILLATNLLVTMRNLLILQWVTIKEDLEIPTKSERDSTEAKSHLLMPTTPRTLVDPAAMKLMNITMRTRAIISCNCSRRFRTRHLAVL